MTDLAGLRAKANRLPLLPGVYLMKNASGKIIYVGKAKKLKNRVSSYFTGVERHTPKVYGMVSQVADFDYIVCDSEFEALTLECSLIKRHMPKYNIKLKDAKGYTYIRVTGGDWPRIELAHTRADDGCAYIGPFTSYFVARDTADNARKLFGLPSCSRQFPKDFGKGRPCLNYAIGNCLGVCTGNISREVYEKAHAAAVRFLKGGADDALAVLRAEMNAAAEELDFERAARLRDRIRAVERGRERQKVVAAPDTRADVLAMARGAEICAVQVFVFREGRLADAEHYTFPIPVVAEEAETDFLRAYYANKTDIPPKIYVDAESGEWPLLARWLTERAGRKVEIAVPKIGSNRALVEMCRNNASELLARLRGSSGGAAAALDELARLLGLPAAPERIEAYDVSNHAGRQNVGGMVTYRMGVPWKAGYRKFRIRTVEGQDDFRSMAEMVDRRLAEYLAHKGEEGFGTLPDLILLDGGAPQLAAVRPVLEKYGLNIPLFGLVKDSRHKTDAIATDGGHIEIKANRRAYTLLSGIGEEVHRFAVGYHRQSAAKAALHSRLTEIAGVGEKKAAALMKHFRTLDAIAAASAEELLAVPGIRRVDAEHIRAYFDDKGAEK